MVINVNDPITLHLSKYTAKDAKKGDRFLGPWCEPLEFFKDDSYFLCDTHIPTQQREGKSSEGNRIYDFVIPPKINTQ